METHDLKKLAAIFHQIPNTYGCDKKYKIYYDETNNIRKLRTQNILKCNKLFAVGGVVYEDCYESKNLNDLISHLKPQDNIKKLKLKHLTNKKQEFFDILDSKKITTLLQYLLELKNCYIHYIVVDPLYYSIVDIIDSIIQNDFDFLISRQLKSNLYDAIRDDLNFFVNLFERYSYPNISNDFSRFFIELKNKVKDNKLIKLLDNASKSSRLPPFLSNNEKNILIDCFAPFYLSRLLLFKNSEHIFDNELSVEKQLTNYGLNDDFRNYRFIPSIDDNNLQISDLIIGILGKYYTFINKYKKPWNFYNLKVMPSDQAINNLNNLVKIIYKSEKCSNVFIHEVISNDFNKKEYDIWKFLGLKIPNSYQSNYKYLSAYGLL